jgi:hypothetical protein
VIDVKLATSESRKRDFPRRRIILSLGTLQVHLTIEEAAYLRDRLTRITKEAIRAIKKT